MLTPMEKRCEFCKESKAVVFCKSDAAHLCLTCDAKVHSANALSYRHPRTLVCESCRNQPAFVHCFDHRTFMCQSCDITHHLSSDHHKKIVGCYVGCPSAKDLAELWGLALGDNLVVGDSDASVLESGGGSSSSRGWKEEKDEKQEKSNSHLIMQQILDLKRLQLSESIDNSCLARVKERACGSPFRHDATWKELRMLEREREEESLSSSPFSHMESFTSNGNGDSFWHCRSPLHNNEIWLQNMQDLGVCDEVQCFEDVNIPEVDPTFRSFEELFGNEEETSNEDRYPPFDRIEQIVDSNSDKAHQSVPRTIKPSYSRSSLCASRVTDGGSGSHYKEKKPPRYEKQGQYMSPRTKSDFKKRGRNQSLKGEGFEGECGSVNGSF